MSIARITDYTTRVKALVPEQLKKQYGNTATVGNDTRFLQQVQAFSDQLQEIEDALWTIYDNRNVNYAPTPSNTTRNVLDDFGDNVGELRNGRTDAVYQLAILAKINQNKSCGEPERLIKALKDNTSATRVWYGEIQPARVYMVFQAASYPSNLVTMMRQVKTGGVALSLVEADPTTPFVFGVRGFNNGHLSKLLT